MVVKCLCIPVDAWDKAINILLDSSMTPRTYISFSQPLGNPIIKDIEFSEPTPIATHDAVQPPPAPIIPPVVIEVPNG